MTHTQLIARSLPTSLSTAPTPTLMPQALILTPPVRPNPHPNAPQAVHPRPRLLHRPPRPPSCDLPALCFRKSCGLVSRVAESNRLIFDSTWLFSSVEGEDVTACSCSIESVDAVTVNEELVEDLERFVGATDGISNGRFLRGDESELGLDWVELEWLKAKRYYSLEAFVVNRLEVALRLAWLNCNGGRRRGVKLKKKASVAGVVANVYWRKKGCVDWWANLDATTRRKVLTVALGKSAKALIPQILKGATSGLEDETRLFNAGADRRVKYNFTVAMQRSFPSMTVEAEFGSTLSGKSTSVVNAFSSLLVLKDIIMIILSCEGIEKSLPNKSKEKLSACSRRKKGRSQNMKKDLDCAIAHKEKGNLMDLKKVPNGSQEKESYKETSAVQMEHAREMAVGKAQTAARKSWKDKNKNKKSRFNNTVEVGNCERRVMEESSFSVVSQDEAAKSGRASDNPTTHNATDDNTIGNNLFASGSSLPSSSVDVPTSEANATQSIQGDYVKGSRERFCHIGSENSSSNNVVENQALPSRLETLNFNGIRLVVPALEFDNVLSNEDINFQNSAHQSMYNIQDEDKNK
ncbi:hypothetical protein FH972_011153 [Carpinus fangiana]|uniref:Uncharacterized protein n=1 Tax=Carpinus fangiana TaxID=176857 RepID=A0A660KQH1_9ROSI|nr:hypothetical protein FH972_011153 [Carpinus fangiana]